MRAIMQRDETKRERHRISGKFYRQFKARRVRDGLSTDRARRFQLGAPIDSRSSSWGRPHTPHNLFILHTTVLWALHLLTAEGQYALSVSKWEGPQNTQPTDQ